MASNRGPNAYNTESYKAGSGNVSSGVGGSWGGTSSTTTSVASQARHAAHTQNSRSVVHISGPTGGANSDGTYEKNLITELCPPGGMKAEPPPDKLQSFAQAIPNLNPDLVCPALLDALEDGQPWIIRAKALCVMEVCINVSEESVRTGVAGNNAYADFFHACKDEIEPLATHARSAVRDPAKRVLKALGLDSPSSLENNVAATPVAAPPAPAQNLLDFGDEPIEVVLTETPPPLPSVAPPAPPVDTNSTKQSLFGGMNMKTSSAESSKPAPVTHSLTEDLLGDVSEPAAPVPTRAPTESLGGGLFDDMAVKPSSEEQIIKTEKENVEVR